MELHSYMTVAAVAAKLGISRQGVHYYIRKLGIMPDKVSDVYLVSQDDFDKIKAHKVHTDDTTNAGDGYG